MRDGEDNENRQVEVVTFRTDGEIQKFLRKKFRKKEVLQNKSAFHLTVYRAGIKALGA